jgi:hypothetical protein
MYCNVIAALLKAAGLEDGLRALALRSTGKVLLTFSSIELVDECIRYFHDPEWREAGFPLSALYVKTMKRSPVLEPKIAPEPKSSSNASDFSFDAKSPVFEPRIAPEQGSNLYAHEFSLDASSSAFEPTSAPEHECSSFTHEFSLDASSPAFAPASAPEQEFNSFAHEFSLDASSPAFEPTSAPEQECNSFAHEFFLDTCSPVSEPTIAPEQESNSFAHEFYLDAPVFVPVTPNYEFSVNAPEFVPAPKAKDLEGTSGSANGSAKRLSAYAAEYIPPSPGESTNADHLLDEVPEGFELDAACCH